jgi:hypothetical protein
MTFLEFKFGVLQIKDYDLLIQYQLYQNSSSEALTSKRVEESQMQFKSLQLASNESTLENLINHF